MPCKIRCFTLIRNPRQFGFTLIELLIVVAIIAILAAIAVPNFLEAQTRSKVSRVRADERTLSIAMEAYAVDKNSYPGYWQDPGTMISVGSIDWPPVAAGIVLSTPVAYITSAELPDPFNIQQNKSKWIEIFSGRTDTSNQSRWGKNCFALVSRGPDKVDNSQIGHFPFSYNTTGGAWIGPYDPTNGTVSQGDIFRAMPKAPKTWILDTHGDIPSGSDPFGY